MSEEEVADLDEGTKKIYDRVKSSTYDIKNSVRSVVETITGNKRSDDENSKYGILDRGAEYYSKDRNIFIDKQDGKFREIVLSKELYTQNSENYNAGDLRQHSALTADQIRKLQTHVNGLGMTMEEYLKRNDINTTPLSKTNRTPVLATFGAKDDWTIYHHYRKPYFIWQSKENVSYRDGILAVLQKQK